MADNRPFSSYQANQPLREDNRPSSSNVANQPSMADNRPSRPNQANQPPMADNRPSSFYEANIPLRGYNQPSSSSDRSNTQKINVIPFTNIPLPTLMEMNPLILSFEEKMKRLPLVLEGLRLEFKSLLPTLPQEQRNIAFFRKCCFDECVRYCRMAFIFNDYRAKTDKIFWLEEFPEQLADFIQLEGLDDIFTTESFIEQFQELEIEPQSVVESPKEPSQSVESPKESSQTIAEPSKTRPAELPKVETLKPVETKFEPFELKSKNVRKVIKQLTDAGFFLARQKGSHQIFKHHENGPQVVVPNHDELKTGTLASIQNQANFALNSTL
jgi:predicted RNA binding protein YcfA (HicA-like mRNA interferase family)